MAQYVVWHANKLEQTFGASEHSSKQMRNNWLVLAYETTWLASNGPIIYLKHMSTGVGAMLWLDMWLGRA